MLPQLVPSGLVAKKGKILKKINKLKKTKTQILSMKNVANRDNLITKIDSAIFSLERELAYRIAHTSSYEYVRYNWLPQGKINIGPVKQKKPGYKIPNPNLERSSIEEQILLNDIDGYKNLVKKLKNGDKLTDSEIRNLSALIKIKSGKDNVELSITEYVPQILGFTDNISTLSDSLRNISFKIDDDTLSSLADIFKNVNVKHEVPVINTNNDIGNSLYDIAVKALNRSYSPIDVNHNNIIMDTLQSLKPLWPLLIIAIGTYLYKTDRVSLDTLICFVSVFGIIYFPTCVDIVKQIIYNIVGYYQPQVNFDICENLFSLFTLFNFGKDFQFSSLFKKFSLHLRDYDRVKLGASSWLNDIINLLQRIVNFFRVKVFNGDEWIFYLGNNETLSAYLIECNSLLVRKESNPSISHEDGIEIQQLYTRGLEMQRIMTDPLDRQKLSFALSQLTPLRNKMKGGLWEGAGARVPPTVICIAGDSQIGKSSMVMSLIYRILAMYLTGDRLDRFIENPDKEIFSYNWDREHQDGADKQSVYLFDDAGCTVDVAGEKNNMYQTIIRITNIVPMHLNMAALELKSDSLFKGEFVILTTNRETWNLNSLHYIPAYVRRLHMSYLASCEEGMKMPCDIDPTFAFEFIKFQKMSYCLDGVKPPSYGEVIGGYEKLVQEIVTQRYKHVRTGTELMDAAKLQIGQALIGNNDKERYDKFFSKVNLKTGKTNIDREISASNFRKLIDLLLDEKHKHISDLDFIKAARSRITDNFLVSNKFVDNMNNMFYEVKDIINVRYRVIFNVFPLDIHDIIKYNDPDSIDIISNQSNDKFYEASLQPFYQPQMLIDDSPPDNSVGMLGVAQLAAAFIPIIALNDVTFGFLQPVRAYIARLLRYEIPTVYSLPPEYKGSIDGWIKWSSWLSARNNCDCALCSLKTFNCPANFDILVEAPIRNNLSGSFLLHHIYIQVLGALYSDNPRDTYHKSTLVDLVREANCNADEIFSSRLGHTRTMITALEAFLDSLPDDAVLPHLCLNNRSLYDYLIARPGWGLHLIAYIRIMREVRLLRRYGKNSFKIKLIKNFSSVIASKISTFRLWLHNNAQLISNITVWSTLFLTMVTPTLLQIRKSKNIEKKFMIQSSLFNCKNVTYKIIDKVCELVISCHKCKKKYIFKFNIKKGFLFLTDRDELRIKSCRTMDVVLNDLNVDTNVNIENFDCRFVDNMTIAVPIFWNDDGKSIDICCNPKFETTILTMINEPIANSLVENVDPLLRAVPENWIPNMNCYDSVEQQIGKKIILGNSLIVHRVLLYAGQSPTADDYKFAMSDKRCSILMLGDRLGVIPNHFYSYIKQQLEKGVISKKNPLVLSMAHDPNALPIFWLPSEDQFYSLGGMEDKDIVIVRIPNMIAKNYSHLSKYFLSRKEIDQSRIYEGSLWTPKGSNSFELRHASVSSTGYGSVDYLGYKNGINWKYKIPTVSGDCGSVLTISNPSSGGRKIVGIHVVGAPNNGLGASIQFFKEDVEAIFNYFKDINNVPLSDSDFLDNFDPQFKCNNSFHVPFCESPYPKPPKFKSKIVPSPLHHIGVVDGLPADASDRVVDGHLIKPYIIALSKSVTPHVLLDHNFLNLLSNYYTWFLSKRSSYLPDTSRRITTQELISGNPEDIYIRPINRKASLGPPYKWMLTKENPSLKGKQEAFGDSDYLYDTPLAKRILSDFDYAQKKAEEGYRVIKYFEDTEKDEILPVDKVKKGKIRVFSIGNFILYLQEKENFVQFSSWFMHNRIYNESGIGMNVFGEDWHKMIMYLSFGSYDNLKLDLFKALDISKFDGSQDRPIQYAWVTIKCNFFPPSDRHRRYCTAENYLNSFHIDKGVIMERDGGNSSGRSGTGEDNTGVLGLDLAYMAIVLYQEIVTGELSPIISLSTSQVYSFLDEYHANNRCCKYGDDVIMSTAPNWRYFKEYSEVNLIRGLNVIGLKATSDAKGDSFNYYRSISDVTFLKRVPKYSKRHLRYVGCLAISSIMKSVQWLKKKDLPIDEYFRVLDKALMELSLHESKESALLINDIIEGGHKLGYMPIATDMGILQDLCLSRDDYF